MGGKCECEKKERYSYKIRAESVFRNITEEAESSCIDQVQLSWEKCKNRKRKVSYAVQVKRRRADFPAQPFAFFTHRHMQISRKPSLAFIRRSGDLSSLTRRVCGAIDNYIFQVRVQFYEVKGVHVHCLRSNSLIETRGHHHGASKKTPQDLPTRRNPI